MILKEHHKEFAIKAFANFMTRKQVVNAFIQEFPNDIPKPPPQAQLEKSGTTRKDYQKEIAQDINTLFNIVYKNYKEEYGDNADEQWEKELPTIKAQLEESYEREYSQETEEQQEQTIEYELQVKDHYKKVKSDLSDQLRRYNITHPKFPKKYRNQFNKLRQEYYHNYYHNQSNQTHDTVNKELKTLYGLAKERAFQKQEPEHAIKHLDIAHNLLKTIVAYNAINPNNQEAIQTETEPTKQLTDAKK